MQIKCLELEEERRRVEGTRMQSEMGEQGCRAVA